MTDSYRGGYKKALLDIREFVMCEGVFDKAESKKQTKGVIKLFIDLLLQDPEQLDIFMETGGLCTYALALDGKVKYIKK